MRRWKTVLTGSVTAAALAAAVFGTGRDRAKSTPDWPEAVPAAAPLAGTRMAGWRAIELYEVQAESLAAGSQRRLDLPGGKELLPDVPGYSGGMGDIPDAGNSGMTGDGQGAHGEGRRGILAGMDDEPDWGWLADDVNAAATVPETGIETGFLVPQPAESRTPPQRTDRMETGFGIENNDDAFFYQRRQDDRF